MEYSVIPVADKKILSVFKISPATLLALGAIGAAMTLHVSGKSSVIVFKTVVFSSPMILYFIASYPIEDIVTVWLVSFILANSLDGSIV